MQKISEAPDVPEVKKESGIGKSVGRLVRAVVFLALALFLIICSNNVLRQVKYRLQKGAFPSFYAQEKNSIDIVTIGSSADYRYIDTPMLYELFGYTSYNLATAQQPTSVTRFIMNEAEKSQSPSLFIVEAREFVHLPESKQETAVYCVSDSMDLSLNKWLMLCRGYASWEDRLKGFFDITKYHGFWHDMKGKTLPYWNNRVKDEKLSWKNNTKVAAINKPELPSKLDPLPLIEPNEKALIELLEDCRKKNREVLFILTPCEYSSDLFPRRAETLRTIVESYGYKLYDMIRDENLDLDYSYDFYNRSHTNMWGAEKVTRALGEYIKREYNIDTQHSDAVKAAWDEAALRNREEANSLGADFIAEGDENPEIDEEDGEE